MSAQWPLLAAALAAAMLGFVLSPKPAPYDSTENNIAAVTGFPPNAFADAAAPRARRVVALGCAQTARAVLDRDAVVGVGLPEPEPDWAFLFHGVPRVAADAGAAAILALKPDLVAVAGPGAARAAELRAAGVRVVEVGGDPDVDGEAFDRLAAAAGVPERGPVARVTWQRRRNLARAAAAGPR